MIYRTQCRCSNGHLIEIALGNAPDTDDPEEVCRMISITLKWRMEMWMLEGRLSDMCEICQGPAEKFVFTADSLNTDCTKERVAEIMLEAQPELQMQRALRHARKNRN